jgi:hypothetical protein
MEGVLAGHFEVTKTLRANRPQPKAGRNAPLPHRVSPGKYLVAFRYREKIDFCAASGIFEHI